MKLMLPALALALAMFLIGTLITPVIQEPGAVAGETAKETEMKYDFIGVKKCSMCHKSEASGNQYGIWQESAHAKAYESLAGEEAKKIAKERDIADPQKAPECLKCHITAFPVLAKIADEKITLEEGVSCESCHGPGSGYWKKATMEGLKAGTIEPASVGLLAPGKDRCVECHNEESPTYKEFDYDKFWAKIAHPVPAE